MNSLPACDEKSFLKSFVATTVARFNRLMLVSDSTLHLKVRISVGGLNLTILVTTSDLCP